MKGCQTFLINQMLMKKTAKKVVAKKVIAKKKVVKTVGIETREATYRAALRIPTDVYAYIEVQAEGTVESLVALHNQFITAYRATVGQPQATETKPVHTVNAELATAPKVKEGVDAVEEIESKGIVTMRSKSFILAESKMRDIKDPNALEVLVGQIKSSVKLSDSEKKELISASRDLEQELTNTLFADDGDE